MIYEFIPVYEIAGDIVKNLDTHYNEASEASKDEFGKANINFDEYFGLSNARRCMAVIAKDVNKLVAYSVFIIGNDINHKHVVNAINTGFFIQKEYRGKITNEFLKQTDIFLKTMGVTKINYAISDKRLGLLLKRKGFKPAMTIWSK